MKKNILIITLLTVCILGSFTFAFASLLPQRDNVQFSETVLFGDSKAAKGLTIHYKNRFDYHLFWDTAWTIGTPPEAAVTDYRFSRKDYVDIYYPDAGIKMESISFSSANQSEGLQKAFEELAETAKPNEKNISLIYISDYYEYYPVSVNIDLPGWKEFSLGPYGSIKDRIIQDFFKIPVLPDDTMEIQVYLNGTGGIASTRSSYGTDTLYNMETKSAFTDDTCYFTFTTRALGNQYVDTSLIPGGFGIYAFPYTETDIELKKLSMVYPLDSKAQIVSMHLNSDQTALFLFTEEENGY